MLFRDGRFCCTDFDPKFKTKMEIALRDFKDGGWGWSQVAHYFVVFYYSLTFA